MGSYAYAESASSYTFDSETFYFNTSHDCA